MSTAIISEDGNYRYMLSRTGLGGSGICVFIMLNPSTADADIDDPTIRRCRGFASDWGFDQLVVVNLFALRTSNPQILYKALDPIGPDNDTHLLHYVRPVNADLVVGAWGAHGKFNNRGRDVKAVLYRYAIRLSHMGLTQSGEPKHPLYLRKTTTPRQFVSE